jgi:hypothetical protein
MADSIPDLWPSILEVKVLTPTTLLHAQAVALARRTQGAIKGDVSQSTVSTASSERIKLDFDLYSPPIAYTERLFSVYYDKNRVYPATVISVTVRDFMKSTMFVNENFESSHDMSNGLVCYTQGSFIALVQYIFNHKYTRSTLESVIARCSEAEGHVNDLEESDEHVPAEGEIGPR